jgi:hypothetical protein
VSAAVSTETTTSGLPRRGDRSRPLVGAGDAAVLEEVRTETPTEADAEPSEDAVPEPAMDASTATSPVAPAEPAGMPASGFGGLAVSRPSGPSLYTVAAHQGRTEVNGEATDERPTANGVATPGGLARRVPGAQRPDAGLATRAPEPTAPEPARTSPEDVYSFLSNFQSGVARGRAEAASDTTTNQEDGR